MKVTKINCGNCYEVDGRCFPSRELAEIYIEEIGAEGEVLLDFGPDEERLLDQVFCGDLIEFDFGDQDYDQEADFWGGYKPCGGCGRPLDMTIKPVCFDAGKNAPLCMSCAEKKNKPTSPEAQIRAITDR